MKTVVRLVVVLHTDRDENINKVFLDVPLSLLCRTSMRSKVTEDGSNTALTGVNITIVLNSGSSILPIVTVNIKYLYKLEINVRKEYHLVYLMNFLVNILRYHIVNLQE